MLAQPQPQPANDAHRHQAILDRLIDAGMQIVDEAVALAKTPAQTQTKAQIVTEAAAAYDRLSRAIRRAILLAKHLDDPAARTRQRIAARKRVIRLVEDHIHHQEKRPEIRERLEAELHERLDSPDFLDAIDTQTPDEAAADIIHDLCVGFTNPSDGRWKPRTPADIVRLCARAANLPAAPPQPDQRQAAPVPPEPAPQDPPPTSEELQRFFHEVLAPHLE